MRGLLVLCLVAVAAADKLGYDYRPAGGVGLSSLGRGGSSGIGRLGGSSLGSGGGGIGGNFGSISSGGVGSNLGLGSGSLSSGGIGSNFGVGSGSLGSGSLGSGSLGSGSLGSGGVGIGGGNFGLGSGSRSNNIFQAPEPLVTEYNKEYYFHSAPEEDLTDGDASERLSSSIKKKLRVIFINAPENNRLTKAALQLAKQATEDKTAIYVLTKENDISDLSQQLQQLQELRGQKPEVRFIKYRTPQDAINAQRAIQAQYDALGGSSRSSDEGVAPVLNYASSSPLGGIGSGVELSPAGSSSSGSLVAPSGSYIPPKNTYLPPVAF